MTHDEYIFMNFFEVVIQIYEIPNILFGKAFRCVLLDFLSLFTDVSLKVIINVILKRVP